MIKHILIPTDGSANSKVALQYGVYLAHRFDARLSGLHVVDIRSLQGPLLGDVAGGLGFTPFQNYLPKVQEILNARGDLILEQFRNTCQDHHIDPEIKRISGVVPSAIADEARTADLVIIAGRGEHAAWTSGLLGSTTEAVIRNCPRPVLVTPDAFRDFSRVLVAYDESLESSNALKTACELFADTSTEITVLVVTEDKEEYSRIQVELEAFIEPYAVKVQNLRCEGRAAEEILARADEQDADLVLMGAFGHNRIHELILGGTTAHILRNASLPVLLHR